MVKVLTIRGKEFQLGFLLLKSRFFRLGEFRHFYHISRPEYGVSMLIDQAWGIAYIFEGHFEITYPEKCEKTTDRSNKSSPGDP